MKSEYDYLMKLLVVGPERSGKSSLMLRYADNSFHSEYLPTIGIDFKCRTLTIEGRQVKQSVWDTTGQERFRSITRSSYRGAHGTIVAFDLTSAESFGKAESFFDDLKQSGDSAIVLAGCKADLVAEREVKREDAEKMAESRGAMYLEASAKTGEGVEAVFLALARAIIQKRVPSTIPKQIPAPAPTARLSLDELKRQNKILANRLEAVQRLVTILGAEGSAMVDGIRKAIFAHPDQRVDVEPDGRVKLL